MRTAKKSELERCRKYKRDCIKQGTVNYLQKASICMIYYIFKACVCYFLWNFYFSPIDTPPKTMKNVFYFIKKALSVLAFLSFPLFFPVSHCLRGWSKKSLKINDVINCLNKNLTTHFVWCLEKEIRCDIETLSIDRDWNKERFYRKIMQKMCFKRYTPF